MTNEKKFAVLIDADNVSPDRFEKIFDEIGKFGIATYRRIYGNWAEYNRNSLKEKLLKYALTPVQQFSYITGKNATDITMVIDAMDILYKGDVDGFCIVSNDSDFTRLALRLRESGMCVIGMGDDIAPSSFRMACTLFMVLCESRKTADAKREIKRTRRPTVKKAVQEVPAAEETSTPQPQTQTQTLSDRALRSEIKEILAARTGEDEWIGGSSLVNQLKAKHPDLDIRDYSDLPLFAGKRKIWSTYFLSLGFCEHKEVRNGEYAFRLSEAERKMLPAVPAETATEPETQEEPAKKPARRRSAPRKKKETEAPVAEAQAPAEDGPKPKKRAPKRRKKAEETES
ncbi:MAG: NYN domain-containing protein [Clostridia bacterium]|nr:NYN domain-containing protein [Clostridia bacterium]